MIKLLMITIVLFGKDQLVMSAKYFIADDTIASNIAFGIDDENIDYDQVQVLK